ncbi:FAD-dependent oxidoreductase [Pedobacter antarcticus]|uniref:FAD-dependent oxidoreductase n=1 Tax=Pedobacter antarcticus TaxID=34086 RepID=UPI000B10E7CD|nr:FAD-dependent oxidoreductase [Pedobacter antarcticus]
MQEHIVIIGGGFAGINMAKALGKHKDFKVTLVDKNNYNFFPSADIPGSNGIFGTFQYQLPDPENFSWQRKSAFPLCQTYPCKPRSETG